MRRGGWRQFLVLQAHCFRNPLDRESIPSSISQEAADALHNHEMGTRGFSKEIEVDPKLITRMFERAGYSLMIKRRRC
jgi:hypothetical protein